MKYCRYLVAVMFFLSSTAFAFQNKIEIIEQFDNLKMVSFVSIKDIDKSPVWNPNSGSPPLSVGDAIQAVKKFNHNASSPIDIKEIEIRPVPHHETHWHYLIKSANNSKKSKYDVYIVLMDKKVISAIIEPQAYK